MVDKLTSRKFIFAILVVLLGYSMVMTKCLTAKEWLGFVEVIGGSYIIGNVASKVTDKFDDSK
jgi:hypothetical protein